MLLSIDSSHQTSRKKRRKTDSQSDHQQSSNSRSDLESSSSNDAVRSEGGVPSDDSRKCPITHVLFADLSTHFSLSVYFYTFLGVFISVSIAHSGSNKEDTGEELGEEQGDEHQSDGKINLTFKKGIRMPCLS